MNKINKGFSLIELMVVVVIIGILASVVVANYASYVQSSNRTEAMRALTMLAERQEQYYMDYRRYAANIGELGLTDPYITESGFYSITSGSADTQAEFTLTATAIGTQANDSDCAEFYLSSAHEKTATNTDCW